MMPGFARMMKSKMRIELEKRASKLEIPSQILTP